MEFEAKIIEFLQAGASDFWNFFWKSISSIGTYFAVVVLLCVAFFVCRKRFLLLGGTLAGGLAINLILKHIIVRLRPYVAYESIMQLGSGSGYSFPSSHSVCVAILAVFLCYFVFFKNGKKLTKVLTIVFASLAMFMVMLSRMYLGLHFLTDVIAGAFVGIIISIAMILLYEKALDKYISKWKVIQWFENLGKKKKVETKEEEEK